MRKYLAAVAVISIACGVASCGKNFEGVLTEQTVLYWKAVFEGKMNFAYDMLTEDSKAKSNPDEFAAAMAFGPITGEGVAEYHAAFAERARVTVLSVVQKRKQATVTAIIIVPSVLEYQQMLQDLAPEDETQTWVIKQLTDSLKAQAIATREVRILMRWILEDDGWKLVYGEE